MLLKRTVVRITEALFSFLKINAVYGILEDSEHLACVNLEFFSPYS